MKLKVIVHVTGLPDPRNIRHYLLQQHRIDYTSLIELALSYWDTLDFDDDEVLHSALEHYLSQHNPRTIRRLEREKISFEEYVQLTHTLAQGVRQIHDYLNPVLKPFVQRLAPNGEVDYRLARFLGMDAAAVIELQPRFG